MTPVSRVVSRVAPLARVHEYSVPPSRQVSSTPPPGIEVDLSSPPEGSPSTPPPPVRPPPPCLVGPSPSRKPFRPSSVSRTRVGPNLGTGDDARLTPTVERSRKTNTKSGVRKVWIDPYGRTYREISHVLGQSVGFWYTDPQTIIRHNNSSV